MKSKSLFPLILSTGMIILSACNLGSDSDKKDNNNANMPNPASVFCEENGGTVEIRTAEDGSQSGACIFPDGSECDEWAYVRGECKPGDSISDKSSELSDYVIEKASDGCNLYHDLVLGYSLHFPEDAIIVENADPTRSFTIEGPLVNDEHWPVIFIAHPQDREDYHPSEDVDLMTWLNETNLIDGEVVDEIQIDGKQAIHTRIESGGQSYNFDHYFFANKGQLFSIVFLHTGGIEDWELYNHIVGSFQFDK